MKTFKTNRFGFYTSCVVEILFSAMLIYTIINKNVLMFLLCSTMLLILGIALIRGKNAKIIITENEIIFQEGLLQRNTKSIKWTEIDSLEEVAVGENMIWELKKNGNIKGTISDCYENHNLLKQIITENITQNQS